MATKKSSKKKVSFHELTDPELDKLYTDLKKEQQDLRFDIVTSAVSNVKRIGHIKKDIARVLTVKRFREMQGAAQG